MTQGGRQMDGKMQIFDAGGNRLYLTEEETPRLKERQ